MPVLPFSAYNGRGLPVVGRAPAQPYQVGLGVLTREIRPDIADEVVGWPMPRETNPAAADPDGGAFRAGVVPVQRPGQHGRGGYWSAMRWLTNGLRHLDGVALPTSPALTRARQRLGARPLELLFGLRRGVLAVGGDAGCVRVRPAAGGLGRDRDRRG
jgi:hypothetical protein